ncbi:hypothetical protein HPHPH30_1232 [Helicobacter pylori Hp H-30]|nr:hypothetical protein HPHPH30_1232 [Helicobacter pylori Hp H-30]
MKLDVIAKDGSCISMNALRDDIKCAYGYDFEAGKAIKQTQYYYVDRENKTQNIGGCVDLQGAQYAMQLYKDDSKCTLQTTSDKGYGMGKTQTFQTEIVFRGMDNLIHVAVPCSDYARVQDRIVRYEKNDKTQTLTPIVDQYYNDPSNPNKQQILNRGIATQLSSQYQEFACGQWEYNDAKLEAKRPTMLKSYNKLNGEWVEVTPCNFEAGIKSGAVVSPYVMGVSSSKVLSDITTSHYFKIERKNYGEREQCQKPYGVNRCQPQYFHTDPSITDWSATYKTTITQTIQPYLRPAQDNESPDVLKERGLEFFDDWAKTYGEVVNDFELDTSAQSYKMVNRFSKFSDVQGLSTMYRAFADIVSNDDILKHNPHFVPKVYGDKPINVVVKRSEEVAQFIGVADENGKYNEGSIIDRMQKCEGKKSKKGQDNILSCTTDARKVALDYRLIDPNAKVEKEFSKSYAMAKNIYENYLETHATKGTQLGFIGLSTPKTHSQKVSLEVLDNAHETENKNPLDEAQELLESLSSYDENGNLIAPSKKELENELKEKEAKSVNLDEEIAKGCLFDVYSDVLRHLVQMGIPQNEIAFIHDAKTEEQKQDLFKKLNRGEVRVLLGSPAKMGVGTNVQERLVAMHELDCPWRPDELLQMEGRGIRQGNILHQNDPENFRMKIYRYATEKTYDSRMWQIIETKSKGIEQFRNAHKLGLNELEDFNMGSSNASEMKAEATSNPLIIEEVKLRAEIKSEEAKYKAFNKEHYFNEENLKNNASKLDYLKQELKDLETLQRSVIIPTHTEIKLYDLKNEESKDYELIKIKEVEPLKENASMSEELTHKKLKEQNKQIAEQNKEKLDAIKDS